MIEIYGRVAAGLGIATKNLLVQLPLIAKDFPEIADCFPGSINLILESPLRIETPDFITSAIDWGEQVEVFHFTRIQFEPLSAGLPRQGARPIHNGWIYGPQNSDHRVDPFYLEIISRQRLDFDRNGGIRVRIDRHGRTAPWIVID